MYLLTLLSVYCCALWFGTVASSLSYFRINPLYLCTYLLYSVFIVVHYGLAQWLAPRLTLE